MLICSCTNKIKCLNSLSQTFKSPWSTSQSHKKRKQHMEWTKLVSPKSVALTATSSTFYACFDSQNNEPIIYYTGILHQASEESLHLNLTLGMWRIFTKKCSTVPKIISSCPHDHAKTLNKRDSALHVSFIVIPPNSNKFSRWRRMRYMSWFKNSLTPKHKQNSPLPKETTTWTFDLHVIRSWTAAN